GNTSIGVVATQGAFVALNSSVVTLPANLTAGTGVSATGVRVTDATLALNASNTFGGGVDGLVAFSNHPGVAGQPNTVISLGQQSATAGSAFNGQTHNFIDVGVGVQPGRASDNTQLIDLDFTGFSFSAPGLTAGDPFGIEDRITHYLDDPTGGAAPGPLGVPTGPGLSGTNGQPGGTLDANRIMSLGRSSAGGTTGAESPDKGTGRPIVRSFAGNGL